MKTPLRPWYWILALAAFAAAIAFACAGDDDDDDDQTGDDDGGDDDAGAADDRVRDYIRADDFTSLVLEVDYVSGHEPREAAKTGIVSTLALLIDKPDGIQVVLDQTLDPRGENYVWTGDALHELADQTDDLAVDDHTIKMHILYVDGVYDDGDGGRVLGLAWDHRHLAVFASQVESTCQSGILDPIFGDKLCGAAEQAILTHEVGHLLGLVDAGLPMAADHLDPEHGHHCAVDSCLMYWSYEGESLVDVLRDRMSGGDNTTLTFGDECLADIAAARE